MNSEFIIIIRQMGVPKFIFTIFVLIILLHLSKGSFNIWHTPHTTIPLTPPNDTTYLFMFNSMNQLGTLAANSFTHLPLLTRFDAIFCNISHVDSQAFSTLNNFQWLKLQANYITTIPDLTIVKNTLRTLDLAKNSIIDPIFSSDFPVLEVLDLSGNNINIFPNITLLAGTLKSLKLMENNIHEIDLEAAFGLNLDATFNSCSSFDGYKLPHLEEFIISDNQLLDFPDELFYLMPKLNFLFLEKNNMTKMPFLDKAKYCHEAVFTEVNVVDNLFHCAKEVCFLKQGSSPDPVTFHFTYDSNNPNPLTFPLASVSALGRSAIDINTGQVNKTILYINNNIFCTTPERLVGKDFNVISENELHCDGMY